MKRFLLAVSFALTFCGVSFAEVPSITPIQPTYRDDNSAVLMNDIQPNREFLMAYQITIDTKCSYVASFKSDLREFTTNSKTLSNKPGDLTLKLALALRSNENAEFTIRVSNSNGETREQRTILTARDGEPRIVFESSEVEIRIGDSKHISIGQRDASGKYSIYSLMELMVLEGLKYEYAIDDPTIATVTNEDNLYFNIQGVKPGLTTLRVKLLTEAEGYPTGDIAECSVRVIDKNQTIPTPPDDNGGKLAPQQPETKKESSGGGGCNAELVGLLALMVVPIIKGGER